MNVFKLMAIKWAVIGLVVYGAKQYVMKAGK